MTLWRSNGGRHFGKLLSLIGRISSSKSTKPKYIQIEEIMGPYMKDIKAEPEKYYFTVTYEDSEAKSYYVFSQQEGKPTELQKQIIKAEIEAKRKPIISGFSTKKPKNFGAPSKSVWLLYHNNGWTKQLNAVNEPIFRLLAIYWD